MLPIIIVLINGILQKPANKITNLPKKGAALSSKMKGNNLRFLITSIFSELPLFDSAAFIGASIL